MFRVEVINKWIVCGDYSATQNRRRSKNTKNILESKNLHEQNTRENINYTCIAYRKNHVWCDYRRIQMKTSHFSSSNYDFSGRLGESATTQERSVQHQIHPSLSLIANCDNDVTITSAYKPHQPHQPQHHQPKGAIKRKRDSSELNSFLFFYCFFFALSLSIVLEHSSHTFESDSDSHMCNIKAISIWWFPFFYFDVELGVLGCLLCSWKETELHWWFGISCQLKTIKRMHVSNQINSEFDSEDFYHWCKCKNCSCDG